MIMNDLQGLRFGRLTVLRHSDKRKHGYVVWTCLCACGKFSEVRSNHLVSGHTRSCGCLQTKHGDTGTKLFRIWAGMKNRCYNKNGVKWEWYGSAGIRVCSEWINDYCTFKEFALENGYKEGLSIHRKDSNKNYEPCNIEFLTKSEHGKMQHT